MKNELNYLIKLAKHEKHGNLNLSASEIEQIMPEGHRFQALFNKSKL